MAIPWTAAEFVEDLRARTVGMSGDISLQLGESVQGLIASYGISGDPPNDHKAKAMALVGIALASDNAL